MSSSKCEACATRTGKDLILALNVMRDFRHGPVYNLHKTIECRCEECGRFLMSAGPDYEGIVRANKREEE